MDEIYLGNWSPAKNPGETPSLEEVRNNAYSAAQTYQNANSWQRQEEEEIDRLNDSIQKAGGKPLSNPWRVAPSADDYAAIRDQTIRDGRPVMVNKWLHDKYERDLLALRDQHPDLISPETVPSFVVSKRMKDAEAKTADISTRRGWTDPKQLPVVGSVPLVREFTGAAVDTIRDPAGMANQFAGGLAGIWNSPADIVANLLPFGAGSASKSIIKNAVINAIGNAGGQAALEPSVQANRAKGGLEYGIGPALEDIAGAAATGAVLDVGVRAPVRAFNRAVDPKMRIGEARNPDTQFGGVLTDAPAKSTLPEPPRPAPTIDPETFKAAEAGDVPALRKLAEQTRAIEDPSVKAMVEHLELTGSVDEAVKRFRDEMQSRTGTAIDDGDLQRTVAGHLRAAIDPDVLPPRREPAAVRPAAEPLMDAEAAKILTDHAPQVSQIVQGLEPRIAAMVSDGLEAGLAPIVRAVQQAIDAGPEGQPQTIANLGNAISKAADAMGGMETFADHITLHSGRSSIMEVATAMRRSPEVVDSNVSFGTEMMQVARAIAMLDDGAFNILARGEADPRIGQMVADTVEPGRQAGVLDQVARAGVRDLDEARRLIADLEPRRIPEPVRDGVDDPNSAETKAATERMEQSMAPEVEMARKAVPEPQPGQSMVDAIMQSAVVRRGAETREAIVDAIRLASKILPEGTRLDIENAEMRDPRTGGLLDAQTASNGDIILAAYAMNPAGRIGHEGVHTLVARGLLSPDEVKLLAEAAGKTEIKAEGAKEGDAPQTVFPAERRAQYAEAYADRANLDQLLNEEAAAHLIEAVVNKNAIPEDAPKSVIERIQKMLDAIAERLKNWRDGKGWQTAEDLINDILNGEVAKREGVKAWMRGEDISALAVKRPEPPVDMYAIRSAVEAEAEEIFSIDPPLSGRGNPLRDIYSKQREEIRRLDAEIGKLYTKHNNDEQAVISDPEYAILNQQMIDLTDGPVPPDYRNDARGPVTIDGEIVTPQRDPIGALVEAYRSGGEAAVRAAFRAMSESDQIKARMASADETPAPRSEATGYRAERTAGSDGDKVRLYDADGTLIADADVVAQGNKLIIDWIEATARRLSLSDIRGMRNAIRRLYPDVTTFEGVRVSTTHDRGRAPHRQSVNMFALSDRETGQSMRRDLDSLGYYSQALEAARSLKQAKGTPEQMLAQLKSAGVKDAEIEATGLRSFLNGKKAVTRDDIVGHLEGNRVGLSEVQRAPQLSPEQRRLRDEARSRLAQMDSVQAEAYRRVLEEQRRLHGANSNLYDFSGLRDVQQQISAEYARMSQQRVDNIHPPVKWSAHSLDPSNPTYRETVLHLPVSSSKMPFDEYLRRYRQTVPNGRATDADVRGFYDSGEPLNGDNSALFNSGHFPEPNIVGHMMTSMTKHQGKPVFTLDQIQSDWGQKLRDGGVRDEAKIDAIKGKIADAETRMADAAANGIEDILIRDAPKGFKDVQWKIGGEWHTTGRPVSPLDLMDMRKNGREGLEFAARNAGDMLPEYAAAARDLELRRAELKTAEAATPGHPLVNTTDQWVNTTLRRALRQAAEAGADYIAIPHGDTVLSYNPGDEGGMRGFYGSRSSEGIVPKNLRKLLEKLDKDSARPVKVDNLETPSGTRGYRRNAQDKFDKAETGFTLFPLTDKVKAEVTQRGQAMFAFAGEPPEAIARAAAERFGLPDGRPHDVLVALGDLIDRDRGLVKNVRASVKAERDEARQFIDLISKAMSAPKEDQGIVDGYTAKIAERYSGDDGTERSYVNLYRDGKMIADATVIVDQAAPNTMVIEWIETLDGTRLSVSDIRAMRESIRAEFPNVKKFSGFRVSGAKEEQFAETDPRRNQTVVMFAFAGEKARTADLDALSRAQQMEADGVDRDTIWRETGWGKFPDGRWKFETDDSKAQFLRDPGKAANLQDRVGYENVSELFGNESLFSAYPDMANAQLVMRGQYGGGYYDKATMATVGIGKERFEVTNNEFSPSSPRSILLHEMQHAVQGRENFARGTRLDDATNQAAPEFQAMQDAYAAAEANAQRWRDLIAERTALIDDPKSRNALGEMRSRVRKQISALDAEIEALKPAVFAKDRPTKPTAMQVYNRFAGEVEARTVQKRMNMTAEERRARAPWHDFDVPEDQQIVRFANGTGLSMFAFSQEAPVDGFSMRGLRMYAIRAYHGSPHRFDRFSLDHIGNGEGAQAFGHGLYFAQSRRVAQHYQNTLSRGDLSPDQVSEIMSYADHLDGKRSGWIDDTELSFWRDEAEQALRERDTNADITDAKLAAELRRMLPGHLYEVDLNAQLDEFLDWDKPVSEQPAKAQAVLKAHGIDLAAPHLGDAMNYAHDWNGVINGWGRDGARLIVAEDLRKAGIRGITYLDAVSRDAGDGSRNYVVFDDNIIEIVAKDGVPVTKQERAEIIGRMQPEQKAEPQSPFPSDLQTADRLKDAGEAINVKPDDGAMYALADPKSVIDELERKSTLGKSEADEIRKKLDHLKAAGMSDDAALDAVAAELEGISEDKKRVALLGEKARQTLIGDLVKYRNHRGETDVLEAWKRLHERYDTTGSYIQDLQNAQEAIQRLTLERMGAMLKEFRRGALTGDMRRKTGRTYAKQQNMVRELFGESTGDQTAKELATAVGAMFEDLRLRFNKAGGHIGKLEKWGMPQGHDAQALRDYGMQKWVDYMLQDGVLDRDRMVSQHTGRKLTDGELRDALTITWQRITTDGWVDREITGQPMGRGALFNQHADHRFLHFQSADAWLRYAKDFGNPDPYAAIMNHVARMSRDIAHMERLGPNPQMMRTYIRNWMTQKAASAGSVESLIREQQEKMAQLAKDHAEELKDLLKGRQQLLDELAERYLDMERVKMRSAIKRGLGMKEEQAKRLADLDARTRVIDNMLYNRTQQRDLLTMRHAMVREQIADMMRAMREAVEISSDKDPQAALNNTLNRVDAMWEVQRGALVPVSTKMANVLAIGRNIISADALGSAVISSITDPAYGQEARKRWGESFARSNAGTVMAQTLKQMFKPGARWEALDAGIAIDSAMSVFHSQAKQNKSWLPWMRDMSGYINDRVLSLGLLTPWTEAGKAAHGTWLQLYLGRNAHLSFEKLAPDIQKGLTANGFDAASWDQIRMSRLYDPKTHGPATRDSQAKQLRPKEIEAAAGQALAERYIAMIVRETRHGVIETTVESRAMVIGTTRPGSIPGEIVRSAGQFKGFPLAVVFIVLGRLAREIGAGDYKSAARHAASLAITSAFLGFAAMALKDIKDGRDPRRLLDEKTWMAFDTWAAAILQAGGLGIWGDFLFSNVNRQGNGLAATLGGPMVDRIDNIKNLTIGNLFQIYQGKDTQVGREGVRFLRQNVPGVSSWFFTSMAWNRIFMDEMQRMVDPKAHEQFRAQIMNRRRDYGGQEYWWKPGQTRPERAPDLTRPFATQ